MLLYPRQDFCDLHINNEHSLPRMLGAIIAGMGLSVAGVILQGVMNNALASPNTIGVNSGAGFFVMLAMMLFPHSVYATSIASFVGALLTTLALSLIHI